MDALRLGRAKSDAAQPRRIARDWFSDALQHERNPCTLTLLGNVDAALEDEPAARRSFEEAIALDPHYEEALFNLADIEKENDLDKASSLLRKAIEIDPQYAAAHRELGVILQKEDNLQEAEYHLRRALEFDPADYWAQMFLANLLGVQGRNEEAEQTYRFATTLHPEITDGIEIFARFLDSVGKAEEATAVREHSNLT